MGLFSDDSGQAGAYAEFNNAPHKAELSSDLISGAAAYEADKAFEKHVEANGWPDSLNEAKEMFAAIVDALVDQLVESQGLNSINKKTVKDWATRQGLEALDNSDTVKYLISQRN